MYKIRKLDEQAIENAEKKWNSIAKPLHSLGVFEEIVKNIAGIQGTQNQPGYDFHRTKRE